MSAPKGITLVLHPVNKLANSYGANSVVKASIPACGQSTQRETHLKLIDAELTGRIKSTWSVEPDSLRFLHFYQASPAAEHERRENSAESGGNEVQVWMHQAPGMGLLGNIGSLLRCSGLLRSVACAFACMPHVPHLLSCMPHACIMPHSRR